VASALARAASSIEDVIGAADRQSLMVNDGGPPPDSENAGIGDEQIAPAVLRP
jgi:hypothetical protein